MTPGSLARIMMVDDEPAIQTIGKLALESIGGFTVRICGSGKAALAAAPEFMPDLILLDVMMPEMTGPSLLVELRKLPQMTRVPVIFVTANIQAHEVAQYRALGALAVIPKPFDPLTLSESIRRLWADANV
ncbi:MAG: response regulator [Chloroflexi bacterium]|nr:response regulator [Chloroflexota bacterium]